ncbi:MAG: glycosyltransferase [Phycisphaerales bacterium]
MPIIDPPDAPRPVEQGRGYAPSWAGAEGYLSDEHRAIHGTTKNLPGWQDPADSEKLYELAYRCGGVILEIGVYGGRSAVVELRGALAAAADRGAPQPQYFGVDIDPAFFERSAKTLADAGLAERCLLYHGDLRRFLREIPIVPTMVFVDGDHSREGVWADLEWLRDLLAPGTPVLCHDYWGIEGVRRAVDEWVASGAYDAMGTFAGSMLLRAEGVGGTRGRAARGLSHETFGEVRDALWSRYTSVTPPMLRRDRHHTPVRDLTVSARRELCGPASGRVMSGRATWPFAPDPDALPVPATMPGGKPWPRITVLTPTFNQGRFIEETLLSVLNQGYPNLEYIVLDGGSTDETLAVVERYRDRLAFFESRKDDGQSDAINRGFARATGEILTWLNSDDMLAPGALAAMALAFALSGADVVAGVVHVHKDGKWITKHVTTCDNGPLPLDEILDVDGRWLAGQFYYQPEVFFTKAIWEKAGGYVDTGLYHSMDYDLWVRMAGVGGGAKLHVIGRPIAYFRAHPEQKTAGTVVGGYRAELPKARDAAAARLGRSVPASSPAGTRPRLRVAMFNDIGYAYGAGIAHRRIAHALALAGHDVHVLAATRTEPVREPAGVTGDGLMARLDAIKPDLVVVGNLHGAELDAALLGRIAERYDTAFVMHDLWLLTGRCAYPGGCSRYAEQCHAGCTCPGDHPALRPDLIRPAWETKRRIIASCPKLQLWAASRWTFNKAAEALAAGGASRLHHLRLGIETDVFRPRDRMAAREALGLPRDRFIIMSSASSLADPRKGLAHLADALDRLSLDDAMVVCVGWFKDGATPPIPNMRAMGYLRDPHRLAMLYAAADLFVGPSLEEAFGQVFLEAAACGTPSIGYPVGGVPEAILDGVSGRVAASTNPAALAEAIDELYHDAPLRASMGRWGRSWVENEWSLESLSRGITVLLHKSGVAERAGLVRRLNFRLLPTTPPPVGVLTQEQDGWRAIGGFEPWAGPFPNRGLPRCRWAHGPVASFEVESAHDGPARLLISCRSPQARQRLRLVSPAGGEIVGEQALTRGDHVAAFRINLRKGANRFDLHLWRWRTAGKPLGLIVTSITTAPMGAGGSDHVADLRPQLAEHQ